jgi:hypothetical protein
VFEWTMGTDCHSEVSYIYALSGSFEPIISFQEYRVVSQPSIMSLRDRHIVLNFLSYDPRDGAPEWKSKIFVQFVELTQGTRPVASCSGFRGSTRSY